MVPRVWLEPRPLWTGLFAFVGVRNVFQPVSSRASFPEMEERILEMWRQKDIFRRSVEARQGGPTFLMYEGPPTANGSPGIHHGLARVFKDVIPRYKTMKGCHAPRKAGWDTHGLPVELEIEKKLGFSGKAQIEEYGIEQFNALCRQSVFGYIKEWETMTERLGYWTDMEHPYVTMDPGYMESVWWAIKQMWDKGLVYLGYRVTPHCPRCGTSLSSHEVALGYKEDTADPSVHIKFRVTDNSNLPGSLPAGKVFLLAWTTTPWTLPGNTALAVAADAEYAVVEREGEFLILASARLADAGFEAGQVEATVTGSRLVDTHYEPLFNPHRFGVERLRFGEGAELQEQSADDALTYRVIATDFVSMDDGTGIVHVAPAYGELDFEAGKHHQLSFVHHVDMAGKITGSYPFAGKFVKTADPLILEDLHQRGLLFKSGTVRHTYPFCWRCEAPLLYYAKQTWYIRTTSVKDALIEGNNQINWYPEHVKRGRFGNWLENNVDWAFSRERYWGTPLPVWQCPDCQRFECVGSVEELKKAGARDLPEPLDLHRPFVDRITFACPGCSGEMRRVPEVIDCWFDSGAMPLAQLHYPFENKELFDGGWGQADYISEAIDQTRGWFYSLHAISTLLFGRPCYRNVVAPEFILSAAGDEMHKSKGTAVDPATVFDKYGADVLRWYYLTSAPLGNVRHFSEDALKEMTRQFLLTLWNVYSFFVTYANIDNFTPVAGPASLEYSELDRWLLSELNQLIVDVDSGLENYDPTGAGRKIETFVDGLSNWYVRRSRRRFWKSENDADKTAAYSTLYHCLVTLAGLLAPFMPFLADELYQNLVGSVASDSSGAEGSADSIHLTDFPIADESRIDRALSDDTRLAMRVSSLGRAARSRAGIKVRQPLARVVVSVTAPERQGLERLAPQVLEELNVKRIEFADAATLDAPTLAVTEEAGLTVAMDTEVTPELAAEGLAREIVHRLQNMRRSSGFDIADHITTWFEGDDDVRQVLADWGDYIRQETLSRELIEGVSGEGVTPESFKLAGHEVKLAVRRTA